MIESVNVNGTIYDVEYVPDLDNEKAGVINSDDPHEPNWGVVQWREDKIFVNDNYKELRKKTILLHEILHAIIDQGALSYESEQEKWIRGFTYGLIRIIKDNPELIKYIQEKEIEPERKVD